MYSSQRIITIDQDQVNGQADLTNFVFLFKETANYLKTVGNGGKIQNSNGYDIIFTLGPDISSKLDHEIINYDSVTGQFIARICIPTVYYDKNTILYIYYGDSSIDNSQENVKGVWDNNYQYVSHLKDLTTSTVKDSAGKNNITSTKLAANQPIETTGKIYKGQQFDGINDLINCGTPNLSITDVVTVSFWFYPTADEGTIISQRWVYSGNESGWEVYYGSNNHASLNAQSISWNSGSNTNNDNAGAVLQTDANALPINGWHHCFIIKNGTSVEIYIDGSLAKSGTITRSTIAYVAYTLRIGRNAISDATYYRKYLTGILEELKVSNTNRSASYLITEYNNENSPSTFYSISTEIPYGNFTKKRFVYKVYDGATYVITWSNEVLNEPQFRNVINGGTGEIIIRLDREFDSFGEDVDIKLNNRVELWISDRQYPNGLLFYKGFISGYRPVFQGNIEFVEVTVLSYVFELGYYILRNTSGQTTIAYNSYDPSDILKDAIDKYRADGGQLNYSDTSIETTNTTVSYTFNSNTIREVIDKVIELAPEGWYWYIDSASIIHFKAKNALADHTLIIGNHINQMETWRRIEDVINQVYFTGNTTEAKTGLFRVYSNSGSIDTYGRHAIHQVDGRVTLSATADTMANRIINNKKDPEIRTRLTILDNNGELENKGYDIESIRPGQTLKIRNIKGSVKTFSLWDQFIWDVDIWDQTLTTAAADVIQILQIEYTLDSLTLEASSRSPEIAKRIEDIQRNLVQQQTVNNPIAPIAG